MGIKQIPLSLDVYFNTIETKPIIVNDLDFSSESTRHTVLDSIRYLQEEDTISTKPKCDCGALEGEYLRGKHCDICNSEVKGFFDKRDPQIWLRSLSDDMPFLAPFFWFDISTTVNRQVDVLRWIGDPFYNPPNTPEYFQGLKMLEGFERSYKYLINNLEAILSYLCTVPKLYDKVSKLKELISNFKEFGPALFSRHIPVLNKNLFVMEKTTKGTFTNLGVLSELVDIVMSYGDACIRENNGKLTPVRRSEIATRTISNISKNLNTVIREYAASKTGFMRKHIYGTRSHFTFRSVITSISGPHDYNDIHCPWSIGVTAFRPHLLNILVNRRGMRYKEASKLLYKSINSFEPIVNEALETIIEESPYKGIPITIHRNQ